jgi:hypothetical protein
MDPARASLPAGCGSDQHCRTSEAVGIREPVAAGLLGNRIRALGSASQVSESLKCASVDGGFVDGI